MDVKLNGVSTGQPAGTPSAPRQVPGRIRARSRFNAVKIHGANSPQVLAGEVPLGHRETISDQVEQYIELDYDQAVEMFGQENADELFKGVKG